MRLMTAALALMCAFGGWIGVQEKEKPKPATEKGAISAPNVAFEAVKKLVGDWYTADAAGKSTGHLHGTFRLTAGGSAVVETMMPKDEHEMITVYHMDNGRLMLTHYCSAGNQPRMRATETSTAKKIVFDFVDATNLASPKAFHMHDAVYEFIDDNHVRTHWTHWDDGKPAGTVDFDLVRIVPAK